ncbi:LutC/YkgG family protein [Acidocella sp.]|jgi:L-lactate dehydrogenase complex protein LldG|uniref:LutC/YkgG family protein n=1 Tax=Acidocella sp. TaxID=50710 RepID=UPI002F401B58
MSRAAILGNIRRGLKRGPLPADQQAMLAGRLKAHPRHLVPARGQGDSAGQVAAFIENVAREFGTTQLLPDWRAVPEAITSYLAQQNIAAEIVVSPHPELQAIPFAEKPLLNVRFGTTAPTDAVTVTQAFAGIAETGTLMMPSGPERPTSNNLLSDTEIVVIRADRIVGAYEDAFDLLRAEQGGMPRNVMLVTGPSRSADIEQTLELGAHGPRSLHVLIIDGED